MSGFRYAKLAVEVYKQKKHKRMLEGMTNIAKVRRPTTKRNPDGSWPGYPKKSSAWPGWPTKKEK